MKFSNNNHIKTYKAHFYNNTPSKKLSISQEKIPLTILFIQVHRILQILTLN